MTNVLWHLDLGRKKRKASYSGPTLPEVDGASLVDRPERIDQALRMIRDAGRAFQPVGFDTETVGCDPRKEHPKGKARAVCAQFSCGYDPSDPSARIFVPNWGPWEGTFRHFKGVLEDPDILKVGSNLKYDMHVCGNHGITLGGFHGDTQIMDTLHASGEMYHGLKPIMERFFGHKLIDLYGGAWGSIREYAETFKQPKLKRDGTPGKTFEVPRLDEVVQQPANLVRLIYYACKDPLFSLMGFEVLKAALEAEEWVNGKSYWDYYKQFDLPYTQVLYRIERRGCRVDVPRLEEMHRQVTGKIDGVVTDFLKTCQRFGVPDDVLANFNLGSTQQVGNLFEVYLRCPIEKRTPTGKPSTDDDSLMGLRDPVAKEVASIILEYRELDKLRGTYVEPFIKSAGEYGGKVHTNLKQTGTATLRLSSSAHNLQNIPSMENDSFHIREAFIAPDGMVVGDIDLSQIEMRLAAHFTNDPVMVHAINNGWDLHSLTATEIDREVRAWVGARTVDKDLLHEVKERFPGARRRSKTINFGVLYGMGPMKYAQMAGVSEQQGKEAVQAFFNLYSGMRSGIDRIQRSCHRDGHVRTILRRRVAIPFINSDEMGLRKRAERQAFNYVIQGSAADLLKMSMLLIDGDERLKELGVEMTLQIHDELLFNVPKGAEEECQPIIEEYVSHPYRVYGFKDLRVDTPAEIGFGPSWGKAKQ